MLCGRESKKRKLIEETENQYVPYMLELLVSLLYCIWRGSSKRFRSDQEDVDLSVVRDEKSQPPSGAQKLISKKSTRPPSSVST